MRRPVCYDVTRLLTRILNATPNGIDRVDHALASHLLAGDPAQTFGLTATGFGARLMSGPAAAEAVAGIAAHWGETRASDDADTAYRDVVAQLTGAPRPPRPQRHIALPMPRIDPPGLATWLRRHGLPLRRTPRADLPPHAVYVNSSQFPLWVAGSFAWLEGRPDVRAAFFIHDLLPVQMPEYFRPAELERHRARLRNFARFAAAGIVTTRTVAEDLRAHLAALGRRDVPVFVAPTPIAPIFASPRLVDPALADVPYFVLCSTLEPRKNHLMILAVWRELARRLGSAAPRLVLVGTRGWHYQPILDLIARSPALRALVVEVNGLSTPGLKRLIDNACAVLMPSFGEGYGLPVHEALAAGAPVLASDVPAFREIVSPAPTLISPLDGEAWVAAIVAQMDMPRSATDERAPRRDWSDYFAALETFLDEL